MSKKKLTKEQRIANLIAYLALDAASKLPNPLNDSDRVKVQYKIDKHLGLA